MAKLPGDYGRSEITDILDGFVDIPKGATINGIELFSGTSDLWGSTWTPANITGVNFGWTDKPFYDFSFEFPCTYKLVHEDSPKPLHPRMKGSGSVMSKSDDTVICFEYVVVDKKDRILVGAGHVFAKNTEDALVDIDIKGIAKRVGAPISDLVWRIWDILSFTEEKVQEVKVIKDGK